MDVVAALENVGELASTPGESPVPIVAARVLEGFPFASFRIILYGTPAEASTMSLFPSTMVYVRS